MKIREPEKKYDFMFRGGHVVDTKRGIDKVCDVLVINSRIVETTGPVDPKDVKEVVDCSGYYVLPGLINFHGHYAWKILSGGICPEIHEFPNGVTTVCDAGSTGSSNFEGMCKNVIMPSTVTMRAFINVASGGLGTSRYTENIDPSNYDPRALEYIFEMYRDYIIGLKLRIGKDINDGLGLEPLKESVKLGDRFGVPLALHATYPLEPLQEIMPIMRNGDILCHTLQKMGEYNILDENKRVLKEVWDARKRGVVFDCAHGRIHFSFDVARAAFAEDFYPDIISSDIISISSFRERMFSLPMVMTRALALGMPFNEVIKAVTETPAKYLNLDGYVGTLKPGALADICVLKKEEKQVEFTDCYGAKLVSELRLVPQMTLKAGRVVYKSTDFCFK